MENRERTCLILLGVLLGALLMAFCCGIFGAFANNGHSVNLSWDGTIYRVVKPLCDEKEAVIVEADGQHSLIKLDERCAENCNPSATHLQRGNNFCNWLVIQPTAPQP